MINLAVINIKTILKKIRKIAIAVVCIAMAIKLFVIFYHVITQFDISSWISKSYVKLLEQNLSFETVEETEKKEQKIFKQILVQELSIFAGTDVEDLTAKEEEKSFSVETQSQEEELPEESLPEQNIGDSVVLEQVPEEKAESVVIQANNKKDVFTDTYQTVQIKNESDYALTEEMVKPNSTYKNKKDIIIYHTHTCESYTPTENSQYTATGNFRTTDLNFSVARVGTELTNYLAGKGYSVIHDTTYHDYPAYTGSYARSLSTVENLLGTYKNVDMVLDIHRDALRK